MGDASDLDEEYGRATAHFYDAAYARAPQLDGRDVRFYRELARESGGPVLELGCGTGRVLLEIARLGIPCTGLDASPHMLARLRQKSPFPDLRVVCAPMQRFELPGERFAVIFSAFRAFQHLLSVEDQLGCLACVRRHLAPGGRLAFDVFAPSLARTALLEEPEQEDLRFELEGEEVVRLASVRRDPAEQLLSARFRYRRFREGRVVGHEQASFRMRWFWRFELEHLLARAGFAEVAIFGDFDRRPVGAETPAFVVVAR